MQDYEVSIHPLGPTPGVKPVFPTRLLDSSQCESRINIGLFFDGTGNNKDWDGGGCSDSGGTQLELRKESNVARLFFAYPYEPTNGNYSYYIPGVGTPFPDIGEAEAASTGMAFGGGGAGRVAYGVLQVLNSIHLASYPASPYPFGATEIRDLCSAEWINGELLDREDAISFYRAKTDDIANKVKAAKKPKLVEVFIDVFGFSRGSAEARSFCSLLDQLFVGDTFCGVKTTIRFLGIFDTVASVGIPNAPSTTYGATDGHMAWADAEYLQIPSRVTNCVHLIAMHENRSAFPLDRVWHQGQLPANCQEFAFPGMHSDVGGGYGVMAQGRGQLATQESKNTLNSDKLSQLPLDAMFKAALAAKVPLDKKLVVNQTLITGYDPFQISSKLTKAYKAFHTACSPSAKKVSDWLISYLAWRYQARYSYTAEAWFNRASEEDRQDIIVANATLLEDIDALEASGWDELWGVLGDLSPGWDLLTDSDFELNRSMAPEAPEVLKRMKQHVAVSEAEAFLFMTYAHDSVAGFRPFDSKFEWASCSDPIPEFIEPHREGYIRYRRYYTGSDKALTYKTSRQRLINQMYAMDYPPPVNRMTIGQAFAAIPSY